MADRAIEGFTRESAGLDEEQFLRQVRRTDRDLVWDACSGMFVWAGIECA